MIRFVCTRILSCKERPKLELNAVMNVSNLNKGFGVRQFVPAIPCRIGTPKRGDPQGVIFAECEIDMGRRLNSEHLVISQSTLMYRGRSMLTSGTFWPV